jgi:hypothetical protein
MAQRNIDIEEIRMAIYEPDILMPGKTPNAQLAQKRFRDGRTIKVVFEHKGPVVTIISTMWKED